MPSFRWNLYAYILWIYWSFIVPMSSWSHDILPTQNEWMNEWMTGGLQRIVLSQSRLIQLWDMMIYWHIHVVCIQNDLSGGPWVNKTVCTESLHTCRKVARICCDVMFLWKGTRGLCKPRNWIILTAPTTQIIKQTSARRISYHCYHKSPVIWRYSDLQSGFIAGKRRVTRKRVDRIHCFLAVIVKMMVTFWKDFSASFGGIHIRTHAHCVCVCGGGGELKLVISVISTFCV
jgi:hypothetical protein